MTFMGLTTRIHKGIEHAEVNLDLVKPDELLNIMDWLKYKGFAYEYRTYSLGYYDSVEDITLKFRRKLPKSKN